ncbi:MAG: hypothetical protein NZ534_03200, partial [Bacteroidia bacterium]|nr:hypothetical protein [Bacteroidia bacterium]
PFEGVKVTRDVVYGRNVPRASNDPMDLKMDVYEPAGDTFSRRPVVIFIHSGSFLPPNSSAQQGRFPAGSKTDNWLVEICTRMAKKGYVAVSMTHRLGWDPTKTLEMDRRREIMSAVWRAQQDFRACVRFLRKSAAEDNPFRIDPNRIAAGGSSSGAYVVLHAVMLNRPEELTVEKFLDDQGNVLIDTLQLGGFDGVLPNRPTGSSLDAASLSYSYRPQVIYCFGGAIADLSLVEPDDPPIIAVHGVEDNTTPYGTGIVVTAVGSIPIIEVSGSRDLVARSRDLGNQMPLTVAGFDDVPAPGLKPFYGKGFEFYNWWDNSSNPDQDRQVAMTYLDSVVSFITPRTFAVLGLPTVFYPEKVVTSRPNSLPGFEADVFPNPASGEAYVRWPEGELTSATALDATGRIHSLPIRCEEKNIYRIETFSLPVGLYVLNLKGNRGESAVRLSTTR